MEKILLCSKILDGSLDGLRGWSRVVSSCSLHLRAGGSYADGWMVGWACCRWLGWLVAVGKCLPTGLR